ncbi:MAG: bacillithiol biosynthesis cysteine-adding enzyme BshC [Candidatus Sumerlaeaceae bacterium]|nr:bacillithiol biosynthesis cysteine-adding enzyme BshC [Candidatus Sumerlaeaceae bacterium]
MPPSTNSNLISSPLSDFGFTRDLISGKDSATAFLPDFGADWDKLVARRKHGQFAPWQPHEIAELTDFNVEVGNDGGADLARRLADPDCLAVVTGQQPNLFASPMYNIFKAISAVALAKQIAAESGRTVVPIFWVASDDHDFAELRDCFLPAGDGSLENLGDLVSRGDRNQPGSPAYTWDVTGAAPRLVAALIRLIPDGPEKARNMTTLAAALAPDASFETLFCRLMAIWMRKQPMILVAPRLRAMRRRQVAILKRDLELGDRPARFLAESGRRMEAAGYEALLQRDPALANFFTLIDGQRCRLKREGGNFVAEQVATREPLGKFSQADLAKALEDCPANFSPNVVTRPMVQDSALPTVAYVGGPGEVAYLAQLRSVYPEFGVAPSAVRPRVFATVVDRTTAAFFREEKISPTDATNTETIREHLAGLDSVMAPMLSGIASLESQLKAARRALEHTDAAANPHVEVALQKTFRTMDDALAKFRARLLRQGPAANNLKWQALTRASAILSPRGLPQERILSPVAFAGEIPMEGLGEHIAGKIAPETLDPQVLEI